MPSVGAFTIFVSIILLYRTLTYAESPAGHQQCIFSPLDVVLVVDKNISPQASNIQDHLFPFFLEPLTQTLNLGEGSTQSRLAVVSFDQYATVDKQLVNANTPAAILDTVMDAYRLSRAKLGRWISQPGGVANHASMSHSRKGLELAIKAVAKDAASADKLRLNVPVVVLVLTGGKSEYTDGALTAATSLREQLKPALNSKVVVIGLGSAFQEELEAVSGSRDTAINIPDWPSLNESQNAIMNMICIFAPCKEVTTYVDLDFAFASGTPDMYSANQRSASNARRTRVEGPSTVRMGVYPPLPDMVTNGRRMQPYSAHHINNLYSEIERRLISIPTINEVVDMALHEMTRPSNGQFLVITVTHPLSTAEILETEKLITGAKRRSANLYIIIDEGGFSDHAQLEALGADLVTNNSTVIDQYIQDVIGNNFLKNETQCAFEDVVEKFLKEHQTEA